MNTGKEGAELYKVELRSFSKRPCGNTAMNEELSGSFRSGAGALSAYLHLDRRAGELSSWFYRAGPIP